MTSKIIAVICLTVLLSFLCGYGFAKAGKKTEETARPFKESALAHKIHNACPDGYEMYDWVIFEGSIIVDCATKKSPFITTSVTIDK